MALSQENTFSTEDSNLYIWFPHTSNADKIVWQGMALLEGDYCISSCSICVYHFTLANFDQLLLHILCIFADHWNPLPIV